VSSEEASASIPTSHLLSCRRCALNMLVQVSWPHWGGRRCHGVAVHVGLLVVYARKQIAARSTHSGLAELSWLKRWGGTMVAMQAGKQELTPSLSHLGMERLQWQHALQRNR
jgi:hypothetical protein